MPRPIRARPATPPTTPPAMAPMLVDELEPREVEPEPEELPPLVAPAPPVALLLSSLSLPLLPPEVGLEPVVARVVDESSDSVTTTGVKDRPSDSPL